MPNGFGQDQKPNLFLCFHLLCSISEESDLSQTSIKVSFLISPHSTHFQGKKESERRGGNVNLEKFSSKDNQAIVCLMLLQHLSK